MLGQLADRKLDTVRRMDLLNVMSLGPQNVGNKHGCLLQSGARPPHAVLDGVPLPSGPLVLKMELRIAGTKGPIERRQLLRSRIARRVTHCISTADRGMLRQLQERPA